MTRIAKKFEQLKQKKQKAFVGYIMAGDPDIETTELLLENLSENGVDIIELGMPFSDPMAEGPTIQKAAKRALKNDVDIKDCLNITKNFRKNNDETPIVLMGYYNPIFKYGCANFIEDAKQSGVDGIIIVDLPPEEEEEFISCKNFDNFDLIKLTTPTSDGNRAEIITKNASGFVYFVSVAGVTGVKEANSESIAESLELIRSKTNVPICVGFGIKTPEKAREIANSDNVDGIVIGSAIINIIEDNIGNKSQIIQKCNDYTKSIKDSIS